MTFIKLKSNDEIHENIKSKGGTIKTLLLKLPKGTIVKNAEKIEYAPNASIKNSSNIHQLFEIMDKLENK